MPPPIGHNRPRPDLASPDEVWLAFLDTEHEALKSERDALLERFERFQARYADVANWDDSVAGAVSDFRNALRDVVKRADALHTLHKSPVLSLGKLIDGYKAKFLAQVVSLDSKRQLIKGDGAALNVVTHRATQYLQAKEARERKVRQEEAERAKAEAAETMTPEALSAAVEAEAAATAPPAELSRVRGDLGGVMSLRRRWEFVEEESDIGRLLHAVVNGMAPMKFITFNTQAINHAVRSEGLRELRGCVIREVTKA